MKTWRAVITALSGWCVASVAWAGNDDSILLGNDAALTGGAVVATVNDGSALWYNPAGLTRAGNDSVDVGASAFALRKYNIPRLIVADDGTRADASFTEFVTIPSALTYVRRINPRLSLGLGLFASQLYDFTLRSSFDVTEPSVDLRFRLQTVSSSEIARYHLAGGLGLQLSQKLSLGVALFGDYADFAQSQRQSADGSASGSLLFAQVSSAVVQQKVLGFHLRAGATYQPLPELAIALSVESPSVYFYRSSRVTSYASETDLLAEGADPVLVSNPLDDSQTHVELGLFAPVRVRLGGGLRLGRALVSLEADVQSKLRDRPLEVDREFVFNVRAGGTLAVGEHMRLGLGLFTDRASDRKDATGAGQIDYYGATVGAEYQNVRWLASDEPQPSKRSGLTFATTVALRYAYGTGKFPGVRLRMPSFDAENVATDIDVHELTLHIGSGVYF